MLKAMVGMVLLTENDWFYASPTVDPSSTRFFGPTKTAMNEQKKAITACGNYNVMPARGTYPRLNLDFRLCDFQLSSTRRSGTGCVVRTNLLQDVLDKPPLAAMCKVVDAIRHPHRATTLAAEANIYAAMKHLQGDTIPRVFGYYHVWGILHLLALEPVGDAISEDSVITKALRQKMKSAVNRIHSAGYVHGDIARRNFCEKNGKVFLVDLETCRRSSSQAEKDAERRLVDSL